MGKDTASTKLLLWAAHSPFFSKLVFLREPGVVRELVLLVNFANVGDVFFI